MAHLIRLYQILLLVLLEIIQSPPVLEIDIIVLSLMSLSFCASIPIARDVVVTLDNNISSPSTNQYLGWQTRVELSHVLLHLISARCCVVIGALVINYPSLF